MKKEEVGDNFPFLFGSGIDLENRSIFLNGEVDQEMAYRVMTAIHHFSQSEGQIRVLLSTNGGGVDEAFAIYDMFKTSPNPIIIEGYGPVMSAGTLIMQAGDVRALSPESRFMVHAGNVATDADARSFVAYGKESEFNLKRTIDILANRSKLGPAEVEKLFLKDTFMSAQEALAFGFIDVIIPYPNVTVTLPKKKKEKKNANKT